MTLQTRPLEIGDLVRIKDEYELASLFDIEQIEGNLANSAVRVGDIWKREDKETALYLGPVYENFNPYFHHYVKIFFRNEIKSCWSAFITYI